VSNSYFTVLENRKTSKDTGKNRWLPTLCVGACLSCVWAFAVPLKQISGQPTFFMDSSSQSNYFLLNLPIAELPLSENFKLRSKLMGFFTLQDIIRVKQKKLSTLDDYSEHWYLEFVDFLYRKELLNLLG